LIWTVLRPWPPQLKTLLLHHPFLPSMVSVLTPPPRGSEVEWGARVLTQYRLETGTDVKGCERERTIWFLGTQMDSAISTTLTENGHCYHDYTMTENGHCYHDYTMTGNGTGNATRALHYDKKWTLLPWLHYDRKWNTWTTLWQEMDIVTMTTLWQEMEPEMQRVNYTMTENGHCYCDRKCETSHPWLNIKCFIHLHKWKYWDYGFVVDSSMKHNGMAKLWKILCIVCWVNMHLCLNVLSKHKCCLWEFFVVVILIFIVIKYKRIWGWKLTVSQMTSYSLWSALLHSALHHFIVHYEQVWGLAHGLWPKLVQK
jgi:hypothetical protein